MTERSDFVLKMQGNFNLRNSWSTMSVPFCRGNFLHWRSEDLRTYFRCERNPVSLVGGNLPDPGRMQGV